MHVCIPALHTYRVKLAKCSILRVISGYPIMLLYCTAWGNPRDLLHGSCGCEMTPPVGEQLSYKTLLLPFPTIFILPCTSIRLSFPCPPLFFLFSLLLFSHSLSGRATRGGPSQPNPEPTGTRGSIGCNSESINSSRVNVCLTSGKQCTRVPF